MVSKERRERQAETVGCLWEEETREIFQDKSLLLNSCHDSLDNNPHYPAPNRLLKACTIPLPLAFSGWNCVSAYTLWHRPTTGWILPIGLDFLSLAELRKHPLSVQNDK